MDPLSITAGIVAIVSVVTQVIKGVKTLRASLKVNDQICALINELTDLRCVLSAADINVGQLSPARTTHLREVIGRAKHKLSELELIISSRLLKAKYIELAWLREKSKVEAIQKDLHYLTSAFSLALTASTSSSIGRVELGVVALTTTAERFVDAQRNLQGATEKQIGQVHQAVQSLHLQHSDLQGMLESYAAAGAGSVVELGTISRALQEKETSTSVVTKTATTSIAPTGGYVKIETVRAHCNNNHGECCCSCHARRRMRSPAALDNIMGALFVGYTGLPRTQPSCNIRSCHDQQKDFSAHFTYCFPRWFVARALVANLALSTIHGPELSLRFPHIVPDTSLVFNLAKAGDVQGVKYLFKNGLASPYDIGGGTGYTALHYAFQLNKPGNFETVKLLVDAGADLEAPDDQQSTAADRIWNKILGKGNDEETEKKYIQMFSSSSRMEQLERRGFSHLHNIVLGQVTGDLDLELQTPYGMKAINSTDRDGNTPLIWASRRGDLAVVDTMLHYGADVSIRNRSGATALFYARLSQSSEAPAVIKSLLVAGAPVNARIVKQETPLMVCADFHDDPKTFLLPLIEYGADIYACNFKGLNVLSNGITNDHVNNVAFLLEMGAILDSSENNIPDLGRAVIHNSHRVLRLLMERGADAGVVSKDEKKTLLHFAAAHADCETVDVLTMYGLDINRDAEDSSGRSAEAIFAERDDKDDLLSESFDLLLESLGSGSTIFGEIDEKDATMMQKMLELQIADGATVENYFDAVEDWPNPV